MSPGTRLDQGLLERISKKRGTSPQSSREKISRDARKLGIASEAAQILLAMQLGIGHAHALRNLDPHIQQQVRESLPYLIPSSPAGRRKSGGEIKQRLKRKNPISLMIEYLITDDELKSRCADLIRRPKYQDRAIREATTVLENRIKTKAGITGRPRPEELVNDALNPDRNRAILLVGTEPSDQQGFHSICRGIVLAFRHEAHHNLNDDVSQRDALKFVAFIDVLLRILDRAQLRVPPVSS